MTWDSQLVQAAGIWMALFGDKRSVSILPASYINTVVGKKHSVTCWASVL